MRAALPLILALAASPALADPARIVEAKAEPTGETWRVSVTLEHGDTGWDDYADGWRVETRNGTVLATRELVHPHVTEQPFTRSQGGVEIPDGAELFIRASTSVEGWDEARAPLTLP